MGIAPVMRDRRRADRRSAQGRREISTSARSGPTRKRRSARHLRPVRKRRRRGGRLVVFLTLLFLFGFGVSYSLVGLAEEGIAASVEPSTPAVELSKDKTRKMSSSATSCDDLRVLVDRSHALPSDYVPKDLVP